MTKTMPLPGIDAASPSDRPAPRRYNDTAAQRACILEVLTAGPATGLDLTQACNSPDPTARIHELRDEGYHIETHRIDRANDDGTVNRVGRYVLTPTAPAQLGALAKNTPNGAATGPSPSDEPPHHA